MSSGARLVRVLPPSGQAREEAHKELEKITTTNWQRVWKDHLADVYGNMVPEGQVFDPVMRDIEAMIDFRVDAIVTDYPGRVQQRLSERGFRWRR